MPIILEIVQQKLWLLVYTSKIPPFPACAVIRWNWASSSENYLYEDVLANVDSKLHQICCKTLELPGYMPPGPPPGAPGALSGPRTSGREARARYALDFLTFTCALHPPLLKTISASAQENHVKPLFCPCNLCSLSGQRPGRGWPKMGREWLPNATHYIFQCFNPFKNQEEIVLNVLKALKRHDIDCTRHFFL